ncbi:MAG: NUDIX domain-containing protein [bacterium]
MVPDFIKDLRDKVGAALLEVPTAGTFVFDEVGNVLLVRHHEGIWTNPGGIVEPFETPADAAVRETWEETGLLVTLTRLIGVFGGADHHIVYSNGDELIHVATLFEARARDGLLKADGREVLEARWFTKAEALALDLSPRKRRHLEIALDRDAPPYFDQPTWSPRVRPTA